MTSSDGQQGEIITMINTDDVPNNASSSDGDDEYSEDDEDGDDDDDGDSDNGSQSSVERIQRGSEDDYIVVDSGSEVGMSKLLQRVSLMGFLCCVLYSCYYCLLHAIL